ncbi:hypothetical protein HHK36_026571 [Tetracentron sinense]|uniref:Peptidase A1 domain-containing protein n=1 Tax=Tetracentron sinense TaxID=13715 RepID=A0A834YG97_TETSI|nr:hypothetical protein HHK36_026571 [Tetracentron sinense]
MVSSTLLPAAIAVLFISIVFYTSPCASFNAKTGGDDFSIRLIHRDSPQSPLYDPTITAADRAKAAAHRSISRLHYFQSLISASSSLMDIAPKLTPDRGEYLMWYHLGTPPVPVYAVADTASNLIWLQCLPCKNCYNQTQPIFDPSKSSTYKQILCDSPPCHEFESVRCQEDGDGCYYGLAYMDGSSSMGVLSSDTLTFEDRMRNNITFPNLAFGCADDNSGSFKGSGVVGLNREPFSLISQLEVTRFSHCMVPPFQDDSGSRMQFGSNALISGGKTPLATDDSTYYYLTLEGISVGNEKLTIPDGIFKVTENNKGGFIIDSGTRFTMLRSEALDELVKVLGEKIKLEQKKESGHIFQLCFVARSFDDLASAPVVTFHFNGTDVVLPQQSTYVDAGDGLWCLAMLPSNDVSVLGNFQQQNLNVGYDLSAKLVSFTPIDCATF